MPSRLPRFVPSKEADLRWFYIVVIVLIALAIVCLVLTLALLGKSPRRIAGSGSIFWRGRTLSEDDAAQMVRNRLDGRK